MKAIRSSTDKSVDGTACIFLDWRSVFPFCRSLLIGHLDIPICDWRLSVCVEDIQELICGEPTREGAGPAQNSCGCWTADTRSEPSDLVLERSHQDPCVHDMSTRYPVLF